MADGVADLAERWRPDVIVHEDREFGSWVAAEQHGIPHVTVQATAWRPRTAEIANDPLNAVRERHGLARDEGLAGLWGQLFLTTRPRSLQDAEAPLPEPAADSGRSRTTDSGRTPATDEDPFPPRDGRSRVAVTLGTVNYHQVAILRALVDGAVAAGAQSSSRLARTRNCAGRGPGRRFRPRVRADVRAAAGCGPGRASTVARARCSPHWRPAPR